MDAPKSIRAPPGPLWVQESGFHRGKSGIQKSRKSGPQLENSASPHTQECEQSCFLQTDPKRARTSILMPEIESASNFRPGWVVGRIRCTPQIPILLLLIIVLMHFFTNEDICSLKRLF